MICLNVVSGYALTLQLSGCVFKPCWKLNFLFCLILFWLGIEETE